MAQPGRTNFAIICADDLGLSLLLQGALSQIAVPEDIHYLPADAMTKDKARQTEQEARRGPRGGSELTHFFIHGLQDLPPDSAGPLLKAVEEARYARFIFQAQAERRHIRTLLSRSQQVRLPFLSRKMVLGNMKALNHDAKTADQLDLYDGTLGGTIRALSQKDTTAEIRREIKMGARGFAALCNPEILGSLAFDDATEPFLSSEERAYLGRQKTPARQKLALHQALRRQG